MAQRGEGMVELSPAPALSCTVTRMEAENAANGVSAASKLMVSGEAAIAPACGFKEERSRGRADGLASVSAPPPRPPNQLPPLCCAGPNGLGRGRERNISDLRICHSLEVATAGRVAPS